MRFEGKHNYFKDMAHRVKCFKNIPKTLASRHQRLVCYQFATGHSTLFKETTFGPGTVCVCVCVCVCACACSASVRMFERVSQYLQLFSVTDADISSLEYEEDCSLLFPDSTHISRSE